MWTPYDSEISAAYRDKGKCQEALSCLSKATESVETLAIQITNIQSGINQCFLLSSGTGSGFFVSSFNSYLSTARAELTSIINTVDQKISSLENSRRACISRVQAEQRQQQELAVARSERLNDEH